MLETLQRTAPPVMLLPDTGVEAERAGPSAEQESEVKLAETDLTLGFDTRVRRNFTGGVSGRNPQLLHLQPQRRQQLGQAAEREQPLGRQ